MKKSPLIAIGTAGTLALVGIFAYRLIPDPHPAVVGSGMARGDVAPGEVIAVADSPSARTEVPRGQETEKRRGASHFSTSFATEGNQAGEEVPNASALPRLSAYMAEPGPSSHSRPVPGPDGMTATEHTLHTAAAKAAAEGRTLGIGNNEIPPGITPSPPNPLVLADPALADFIREDQRPLLVQLREDFVAAVGGPNQDPADPEYGQRWIQATATIDSKFRLMFGQMAFLQAQQRANLQGDAGKGSN